MSKRGDVTFLKENLLSFLQALNETSVWPTQGEIFSVRFIRLELSLCRFPIGTFRNVPVSSPGTDVMEMDAVHFIAHYCYGGKPYWITSLATWTAHILTSN